MELPKQSSQLLTGVSESKKSRWWLWLSWLIWHPISLPPPLHRHPAGTVSLNHNLIRLHLNKLILLAKRKAKCRGCRGCKLLWSSPHLFTHKNTPTHRLHFMPLWSLGIISARLSNSFLKPWEFRGRPVHQDSVIIFSNSHQIGVITMSKLHGTIFKITNDLVWSMNPVVVYKNCCHMT